MNSICGMCNRCEKYKGKKCNGQQNFNRKYCQKHNEVYGQTKESRR